MFDTFIYSVAFLIIIFMVMLFLLWRHKKAATCDVNLMGALASVEESLSPEGAVLVRGELWRARLKRSTDAAEEEAFVNHSVTVERGSNVRVVGASGYLLEVKLVD